MIRLHETAAYDTERWPESYWRASVARMPHHPPLSGTRDADLAVVGAGYTGLCAALEAAERFGASVAVLEAGQPGWGASGRNGGFACIGGVRAGEAALERRFGPGAAAEVSAFQHAAVESVGDNLASYGIDADMAEKGEVRFAHSPRAWAAMRRAGGPGLMTRDDLAAAGLGPAGFHGARASDCGFGLHPFKYALGLARATEAAGVAIHGASPVTAIAPERGGWRLATPGGSLRARRVIVATNGYSSEDVPDALAGRVLPVFSSILVTRPLSEAERAAQNWQSTRMAYDSRHLLHYFRLLPDGRFLFGTRGGLRATPAAAERIRATGRAHFEALFPAWARVETPFHWSGLVALMAGGVPWVGHVPGAEGMVAALGYHGNGVAAGSLAGRLAARLALAGEAAGLPRAFAAPPPRWPFARFRRLAIAAAYLGYGLIDGPVR